MFAYIKGELQSINDDHIVVETANIGYEIVCPNPYDFTKNINELVKVYTYFYVREDLQMLYGFKEEQEKELFMKLLNVSGIGPKSALNIVAHTNINEFAFAIENEDEKYLTKFPGVGKKTARQMILDLKGKLNEWLTIPQTTTTQTTESNVQHKEIYEEAIEALKALGYTSRELNQIAQQLRKEQGATTDDLVKKGLQLLMR